MLTSLKSQIVFSQGDTDDAVFYIQESQVKLSVVSQQGKEAIVATLERGACWEIPVSPDKLFVRDRDRLKRFHFRAHREGVYDPCAPR